LPINSVSFANLADELRVSPEELVPLVTSGYLVIVQTADELKHTLVGKPSQSMIDWFRAMLGPANQRPIMPIKDVARMFRVKLHQLIDLCERFGIPIYKDPLFEGLISARGVFAFYKMYREVVSPMRVDRQTLFEVLARLKGAERTGRQGHVREIFIPAFDREIQRIAALPEPQRTIAATAFWQIFSDADLLTDVLPNPKNGRNGRDYYKRYLLLKEKAQGVEKILKGKKRWDDRPYILTSGMAWHPKYGWYNKKKLYQKVSARMQDYWKKRKAAEAALRGEKKFGNK
jgi:hypothetical protein